MSKPVVSIVLIIGKMRSRAERSLKALLNQKTKHSMEIIVVDTQPDCPKIESINDPIVSYIKYSEAPSFAHARLYAMPHCSSELIAFVEDHAFAEPGWINGVIQGFKTGADVVIYTYFDATPQSHISRCSFLHAYGRWMSEKFAGERQHGPGNNIAYRKEALLRQGDSLCDLLHTELFLHFLICNQGGKIYQEATAKVAHANWNTLGGALLDSCVCSRLYARQRIKFENPSLLKRLIYVCAIPVLPFVLFWRYCQDMKKDRALLHSFIIYSPIILFIMFCTGMSEAWGYLSTKPQYKKHLNNEVNIPRACD